MINGCDKNVTNVQMIVNGMGKTNEKAMQICDGNLLYDDGNVICGTDAG